VLSYCRPVVEVLFRIQLTPANPQLSSSNVQPSMFWAPTNTVQSYCCALKTTIHMYCIVNATHAQITVIFQMILSRGVRTGGAGSATAPPNSGVLEQCSPYFVHTLQLLNYLLVYQSFTNAIF